MKALLINGSPNKNGVTFLALETIATALEKQDITTEIFQIGSKPVAGCIGCLACRKTGSIHCAIAKDHVNEAIDKLIECDGFVLGAPTYFCGIPGDAKSFLDRVFYASQLLSTSTYKVGAAVTALRRSGGVTALHAMHNYFAPSRVIKVPSQYHTMLFGKSREEALRDKEGMQTMRVLGESMAWLMKSLDYSRQAFPTPPIEPRTRTNFPGMPEE